jgi:hypothetical protein
VCDESDADQLAVVVAAAAAQSERAAAGERPSLQPHGPAQHRAPLPPGHGCEQSHRCENMDQLAALRTPWPPRAELHPRNQGLALGIETLLYGRRR